MTGQSEYARLVAGDWAPWFAAKTFTKDAYNFSSVGGVWLLFVFLGTTDAPEAQAALAELNAAMPMFDARKTAAFCITCDPRDEARVQDRLPGFRWFFDRDMSVSRLYGSIPREGGDERVSYRPQVMLLDPQTRVHAMAGLDRLGEILDLLRKLPEPAHHAGVEMHAPVLIIPRVLEPRLCDHLIGLYEGGDVQETGVMRERDGKTFHELDDSFKRRSDYLITEPELIEAISMRIARRVTEPLRRAFQFDATQIERHIVSCYDSDSGGRFLPHRDNTTPGTAHRRFAVSINLNDGFEGGDLFFPEFGPRRYKAPVGAAVVFGCGLLHSVSRVTSGRRFAYLPFLYDEAAAQVRTQNLSSLMTETLSGAATADA